MIVVCPMCSTPFSRKPCELRRYKISFCSRKCHKDHSKTPHYIEKRIYNQKKAVADWKKANQDRVKEYHARDLRKNGIKRKAQYKEWINNNKKKINEYRSKWFKKQSDNVSDFYVKKLLTKGTALLAENVPQSLVEIKRAEIKLSRALRRAKNV